MRTRWCLALMWAVGLAGCSSLPQQAVPVVAERPPEPARDLLAEVRAAAADAGDVIEVTPWRDPAVTDLLERGDAAERAGDFAAAEKALAEAVALMPDDPDLMQRHAELLLAQRVLDEAERLAALSYERGPRLGSLCRRNWTTVRLAREVRGDTGGAQTAAERAAMCVIEPPVRM